MLICVGMLVGVGVFGVLGVMVVNFMLVVIYVLVFVMFMFVNNLFGMVLGLLLMGWVVDCVGFVGVL